jgi:hypothetical protein
MTKEEDYRKTAAEVVELANHTADSGDKGRRLALAERWLDLADRARRRAGRSSRATRFHPLIERKLSPRIDPD